MRTRIALVTALGVVASLGMAWNPARADELSLPWVKVVMLSCKLAMGAKIQTPMVPPQFSKGTAVPWSVSCGKSKPTINNSNANSCYAVILGTKPPKDPLHLLGNTGPSNCNLKIGGTFTGVDTPGRHTRWAVVRHVQR